MSVYDCFALLDIFSVALKTFDVVIIEDFNKMWKRNDFWRVVKTFYSTKSLSPNNVNAPSTHDKLYFISNIAKRKSCDDIYCIPLQDANVSVWKH